jgi:hypothetical protein
MFQAGIESTGTPRSVDLRGVFVCDFLRMTASIRNLLDLLSKHTTNYKVADRVLQAIELCDYTGLVPVRIIRSQRGTPRPS